MKDPPNFRRGSTNWESCHFCLHVADNDRRFSCLAYECFVLLDTLCDSYERRESGDPPIISRFMREVPPFRAAEAQQEGFGPKRQD